MTVLTYSPDRSPREANGRPSAVTQELAEKLGRAFVDELVAKSILLSEDWHSLPLTLQADITETNTAEVVWERLREHNLLTSYQVDRLRSGTTFGLVLGNYRVLDRIGAGGMGVVFKAEHIVMRRIVAVKVLPVSTDQDKRILQRFQAEVRAVAALRHPNIVSAMDAGAVASWEPNLPVLHYLVMEYLAGLDLEELVMNEGPLDLIRACDMAHQVASALAEAHAHQMVHRDVKPSNIIITGESEAKLLDFGLAHTFAAGLTEAGSILGTVDFMAPEQIEDPRKVDIRADVYALGGTLYWALTGQLPFPPEGNLVRELARRRTQEAPSARAIRPDLPPELDAVLQRMMAPVPTERFQTPSAVMRALVPFLRGGDRHELMGAPPADGHHAAPESSVGTVLVVDDDSSIRQFCRFGLEGEHCRCEEADGGESALRLLAIREVDTILLDVNMPGVDGPAVLAGLRRLPQGKNVRVIMMSGLTGHDDMARMMFAGADDYLPKPFSLPQLRARVQNALRLKQSLDQADRLNAHLRGLSSDLERALEARDGDLRQVRNALVLSLASLVEHRAPETEAHLVRLQRYCRTLAEEAARLKPLDSQIDHDFIANLETSAPLHDIGIIALPDHILLKPGRLAADERAVMESHTVIGSDLLRKVLDQHGASVAFLRTAVELTRSHHERYDGKGYPDRLAGEMIPLSARLLAIGDVYDALRSRRAYRPALSHNAAVQVITEASAGQFDPVLLEVFQRCAGRFEQVYHETPG